MTARIGATLARSPAGRPVATCLSSRAAGHLGGRTSEMKNCVRLIKSGREWPCACVVRACLPGLPLRARALDVCKQSARALVRKLDKWSAPDFWHCDRLRVNVHKCERVCLHNTTVGHSSSFHLAGRQPLERASERATLDVAPGPRAHTFAWRAGRPLVVSHLSRSFSFPSELGRSQLAGWLAAGGEKIER